MEHGHPRERRPVRARSRSSEGSSFCVSAANGDIAPELPHGVFFHDTRLVSRWTLLIDGEPVEPLSSSTPRPYRSVMVGRAGHLPGRADTPLIVERDRRVDGGLREDITLRSYSREPMALRLELVLEADFADIFEVKEGRANRRPRRARHEAPASSGSTPRETKDWDSPSPRPAPHSPANRLSFDIILEARGTWSRRIRLSPTTQQDEYTIGGASGTSASSTPARRFLAWQSRIPVPSLEDDAIERSSSRANSTSAHCASSTRRIPSAPSSPRARRGSWRCSAGTPCSPP
jgi:hypothetical protein